MSTVLGSLFSLSDEFVSGITAEQPGSSALTEQLLSVVSGQLGSFGLNKDNQTQPAEPGWGEGATCIACGIGTSSAMPGFDTPGQQRAHFKTDWHRYNVKRRLEKKHPVSEEAFQQMLDEDAEVTSISGSSSSGSEGEGGAIGAGEGPSCSGRHAGRSSGPQIIFSGPDGKLLSLWRCLLVQDHTAPRGGAAAAPAALLAELRRLRASCKLVAVLLLRGGHFAASLFQVRPERQQRGQGQGQGQHQGDAFDVLAHKTFHRYVVRAGAGGKQSSKDASGKYARSAGSRLRRYNEAALERDVHELLASWRQHLQAADIIFVHAPSSNAKVLFAQEGEAAVLQQSDPRVRRIPFVLRRPTYSETKRAVRVLTSLYQPDPSALEGAAAEKVAAMEPAIEEEEEEEEEEAGKPASAASASTAAVMQQQQEQQQQQQAGAGGSKASKTEDPPLHKASKAGDHERVARLLDSGHDPSAVDSKGRVPYLLATSKAVRDVFRRFAAQQPGRWDYGAAAIPSALTHEMEAAQEAKKAEKKARQRAAAKERKQAQAEKQAASGISREMAIEDEIARAAAEAAALAARQQAAKANSTSKPGQGNKVGGPSGSGSSRNSSSGGRPGAQPLGHQQQQPLSQAEVARRREQMAAAAEARMRALQSASQQQRLY